MQRNFTRHLTSLAIVGFFAILAGGSTDSGTLSELWSQAETEMQSDFHNGNVPPGNQVVNGSGVGTTVQKEAFRKKYLNSRYRFGGWVSDVTKQNVAIIHLDPTHHATVTFSHPVGNLKKGNYIKFEATINKFGTGVLTNHRLSEATLLGN